MNFKELVESHPEIMRDRHALSFSEQRGPAEICGSSHLAMVLKFCTARHGIDRPLGVGAHQDAKVVAPDLPLSIWIPLHQIVPHLNSGLGFVVPDPGRLLPTLPHNDVGPEY